MGVAKTAIKMRVLQDKKYKCSCCGEESKKSLDMFELKLSDTSIILCDKCNEVLFNKTLKASCYTNGRLKSQDDINIINERKRSKKLLSGQ